MRVVPRRSKDRRRRNDDVPPPDEQATQPLADAPDTPAGSPAPGGSPAPRPAEPPPRNVRILGGVPYEDEQGTPRPSTPRPSAAPADGRQAPPEARADDTRPLTPRPAARETPSARTDAHPAAPAPPDATAPFGARADAPQAAPAHPGARAGDTVPGAGRGTETGAFGVRAEGAWTGRPAQGGGLGDPAEALGQESWGRPGPLEPWRHAGAVPRKARKADTDRRRARAAERRRAAAEAKRSRSATRRGPARRVTPRTARAADRHRSALLVMVLTLGLLIAAVAVTGGLIASSMRTRPVPLADPLHIYPVTQTTPGQCPAGTRGITGQSGGGATCYRLEQGLSIHEVSELHVQRSQMRQGGYDVALTLRPADRSAFADLTRSTVGRDLAFVVRDEIVTLPRVDMAITDGKVIVTGPQNRDAAARLVRELRGA
ncbi:SecDF P1 head subdomain-containing protein [Actinomadura algeriensis]|uniref:SecDF P1 head subdomain domain-containing protein n=1 Tax=Actinomadura algeriensis TaxID=1679523 RepID=A0ABR9JM36_9ACTN|nr:hypothetical protein [Actinomadura algeriensis]MBE1531626.1 hypothetical protein [Actinomadura algeriensis]